MNVDFVELYDEITKRRAMISRRRAGGFSTVNPLEDPIEEFEKSKKIITIGYECMMSRFILHAVLHGIGFKDEVSHPHRDQYIQIMWGNIQPRYRHLFNVESVDPQYKVVEYDPMSIMHFHDRAFSINGGPTIAPRLPGLRIKPSEKLSQLDVMKLRLRFGHECNKRKVGALLEKCKTVFHNSHAALAGIKDENDEVENKSVEVDNIVDPYAAPDYDGMGEVEADGAGPINDTAADYKGGSSVDADNEVDGEVDGDGMGNEGMKGGDGGDGGYGSMTGSDGGTDGGVRDVDGGMNGGNGSMAVGDGGMGGGVGNIDGGMNGGNGSMVGGDMGMNGGDGNDEGGDNVNDGSEFEVDADGDVNAVPDDGTRRKVIHK